MLEMNSICCCCIWYVECNWKYDEIVWLEFLIWNWSDIENEWMIINLENDLIWLFI